MSLTSPTYYQHPVLGNLSDYVQHMPYFQGAAFKYVARAGNKPGVPASDDLAKARECLRLQSGDGNNPTVYIPKNLKDTLQKCYADLLETDDEPEIYRMYILRNLAEGILGIATRTYIGLLEELLEQEKSGSAINQSRRRV